MRASSVSWGRWWVDKQAEISLPGGCVIGPRPIDLHLRGAKNGVRNRY